MRQYSNEEMIAKYGKPNQVGTYLAYANMPFPLTIAWDTSVTVKRIRCHKLEVANVEDIFFGILDAYGLDKIKALGIDLFGGCFNYRPMRGGSSWSRHAWGTAIDLDTFYRRGVRIEDVTGKQTAFEECAVNIIADCLENLVQRNVALQKEMNLVRNEAEKTNQLFGAILNHQQQIARGRK